MDTTTTETLQVTAEIRQLNKYVQKAKRVAINSINPVYLGNTPDRQILGFTIRIEGPSKHVSYFRHLIDEAKLKIS